MSAPGSGPVAELLTRVRTRLTPDGAWTQHDFASTLDGLSIRVTSPLAVCWCIEGAVGAELGPVPSQDDVRAMEGRHGLHVAALVALTETLGLRDSGLTLAGWNDAPGRTHADILGVLDLTIARLTRLAGAAA